MTNVGARDKSERWKPEQLAHYLTMAELCREVGRDRSRIIQLEREAALGKIKFPVPVRVKVGRLQVRLYSPEDVSIIRSWFKNAKPGPRR
jgi:hypothetical protein